MKSSFRLFGFLLVLFVPLLAHPGPDREMPPWQQPTSWPDRIIATLDGDPMQGFAVSKDTAGHKTVTSDPVALTPEKTYQNTGPYIGWDDLR